MIILLLNLFLPLHYDFIITHFASLIITRNAIRELKQRAAIAPHFTNYTIQSLSWWTDNTMDTCPQ